MAREGKTAMTEPDAGRTDARRKELVQMIAWSLALWLLIHTFSQPYKVEGRSMEGALHDREQIWVNRMDSPERGEVIVFHAPTEDKDYVKRVIGLPGDHVTISSGAVAINGQRLAEPYLDGATSCAPSVETCDLIVPAGMVFVLGDNRGNSSDSRTWGPLALERVVGRAWMVYWPPRASGPITAP
jgi:signal peptidase I